jgi:hypothetical protein
VDHEGSYGGHILLDIIDIIAMIVMDVMGLCQGESLIMESSHATSWNLVME